MNLPTGLFRGFHRFRGLRQKVELDRRGYSDDQLRAIAGGNCLRVLRAVESMAAQS
jgi:microsomal dipeptidase-like Zn-dependent dipeptidase